MKKFRNILAVYIAFLVVIADQLTKFFASRMSLSSSIPIIKNIVHITLVHNTGAGFGILKGGRMFFIVFSIIVLIGLVVKWKKIPTDKNIVIPLGMILGGLIGNLIDRVFLGYVIDFIDFRVWPVFNAADSCISIGAVWLIIYLWKK